MLESGPWMIQNVPIFLNKWNVDVCLSKNNHDKVPVWVKMHDVPMQTFTDDGLSMIATKLGKPMMLDSYTSTMYVEAWGRPSFARAMIEISEDIITVATPRLEGGGFIIDQVRVEYEWKPPRCKECKISGHEGAECPNKPQPTMEKPKPKVDEDGFQAPKKTARKPEGNKKYKQTNQAKEKQGFPVGKSNTWVYRPVQGTKQQKTSTHNTFSVLNTVDLTDTTMDDEMAKECETLSKEASTANKEG